MKLQKNVSKAFCALGLCGVLSSWATMAFVWMGLLTASYVGYCVGEGIAEWVALWGKHGIRSLSSGLDIPTSQAERVIHADFAIVYPEGRSRRTH